MEGNYCMQNIYLHGLGQNSSSWDKTITYFTKQDHVLCPELFSLCTERSLTYKNLYQAFSAYCDSISDPVNICGLSLGAVLALNYTIDHPEKVKSLILIAAQYKMPKTLLKFQNIVFKFMPESTFKNMGLKKKEVIELTNSMTELNFTDSLKAITCLVLVVCGEKDHANIKSAKYLAENIKKADLQIIGNSGHEVNMDAPERLGKIVDEFFNR